MGKGPRGHAQDQIGYNQQSATDFRNTMVPDQQNALAASRDRYNAALPQAQSDYSDIMGRYKSLASESPININYNRSPEMNQAFSGYGEFANTGGYSEDDITNLRARGISPIRAVYANAMNNMNRQKNIAGGYMPNLPAAQASMARSASGQIADQVSDVNAQIAQARNQGRQFGISGLGGLAGQDAELAMRAQLGNAQAQQARGNLLGGMTSLYQSTPGMLRLFGDEIQNNTGNLMNTENMYLNNRNQQANQYMQAQNLPSGFQNTMGNVGQIANIGASIAAPFFNPVAGASQAMNMFGGPANIGSGNMNQQLLPGRQLHF